MKQATFLLAAKRIVHKQPKRLHQKLKFNAKIQTYKMQKEYKDTK